MSIRSAVAFALVTLACGATNATPITVGTIESPASIELRAVCDNGPSDSADARITAWSGPGPGYTRAHCIKQGLTSIVIAQHGPRGPLEAEAYADFASNGVVSGVFAFGVVEYQVILFALDPNDNDLRGFDIPIKVFGMGTASATSDGPGVTGVVSRSLLRVSPHFLSNTPFIAAVALAASEGVTYNGIDPGTTNDSFEINGAPFAMEAGESLFVKMEVECTGFHISEVAGKTSSCRSLIDPTFEFDQQAFDLQMGSNTFNLAERYGFAFSTFASTISIPEPGSFSLFSAAVFVAFLRRARFRLLRISIKRPNDGH